MTFTDEDLDEIWYEDGEDFRDFYRANYQTPKDRTIFWMQMIFIIVSFFLLGFFVAASVAH